MEYLLIIDLFFHSFLLALNILLAILNSLSSNKTSKSNFYMDTSYSKSVFHYPRRICFEFKVYHLQAIYLQYTLHVRSLKMNLLNILQPSFEVIAFRFFAEAEGIQSLKFSGHKNKYCLHCKNVSCD